LDEDGHQNWMKMGSALDEDGHQNWMKWDQHWMKMGIKIG
jgi:hypothetical protein